MDAEKAGELITSSFPDLEIRSIELLQGGWDNYVFLVNGRSVFRFPIKKEFIPSLKSEIRLLSMLDGFPVRVPKYVHVAQSGPFFAGYTFIDGMPLNTVPEITEGITGDMVSIVEYLRDLEVAEVAPSGIPAYSVETWKSRMSSMVDGFRKSLLSHVNEDVFITAHSQIDGLLPGVPESSFRLVHSDLYRGNVLVKPGLSGISAVIDWQEAAIGDIALDVAALALDFGREFTARLAEKTLLMRDTEALQRAMLYQRLEPFHILEHRIEKEEMHGVPDLVKRIEKSFLGAK